MCLKSEKKVKNHPFHSQLAGRGAHSRTSSSWSSNRNPESQCWKKLTIFESHYHSDKQKKVVKLDKTGVHWNYLRDAGGENVPLARFRWVQAWRLSKNLGSNKRISVWHKWSAIYVLLWKSLPVMCDCYATVHDLFLFTPSFSMSSTSRHSKPL